MENRIVLGSGLVDVLDHTVYAVEIWGCYIWWFTVNTYVVMFEYDKSTLTVDSHKFQNTETINCQTSAFEYIWVLDNFSLDFLLLQLYEILIN